MDIIYYIIIGIFGLLIFLYIFFYFSLLGAIKKSESYIVDIFLEKIAKIPAVIEVMRPYVVKPDDTFREMIRIHTESIIQEYSTIHDLLEKNTRINEQYSFLMRLSMVIPEMQKDSYFLYIRDFVMTYDSVMKREIPHFDTLVARWNRFIFWKNMTGIGFLLPGSAKIAAFDQK